MRSNNLTYQLFSLSMALLILLTSLGITLDMHFCKGELKSISFFGEAKSCHDTSQQITCPHHKDMVKKNDCCENKKLVFQADIDKELDVNPFVFTPSINLTLFVFAYVASILDLFAQSQDYIIFTDYTDPIPDRDIYVLLETFLL